jgi:hypothetical protein
MAKRQFDFPQEIEKRVQPGRERQDFHFRE